MCDNEIQDTNAVQNNEDHDNDIILHKHKYFAWFLYKCKGLWSTICGPPATERTLGAICKGKGISSRFQVSISSQYDLSC